MRASPSKLLFKPVLTTALAAVLAACGQGGGGSGGAVTASSHSGLHGTAHGGQQGLVGSTVTIYAAGTYAGFPIPSLSPATQIATTTTGPGGVFSFPTFSCSSTGESNSTLTYVTITGGNPGSAGIGNSAINLVSALGQCQNLPNDVNIDEVTTAAAAYALARFTTTNATVNVAGGGTATGTSIAPGTSNSSSIGLANAFATANALVNTTSGNAAATLPLASAKTLYALSNSIAACVNSGTNAAAQCGELFNCALPGASFSAGSCSGGSGTAATETLGAALKVAQNPGTVSIAGVYDVATRNAVFSPSLSAAPSDWTLSVNYTGGGLDEPYAIAIDASGNVWLANDVNPGVVSELSPIGAPLSATGYTGGGLNDPLDLAIDPSGRVWISNSGNNSVTQLVPGATPSLLQISSSQFNHPYGIAADTSGNIWVANQGNNTLSTINSSATVGSAAISTGGLNAPVGVVASNGGAALMGMYALSTTGIWVSNGNGTVSQFSTGGSAVSGNGGYGAGTLNVPTGIAGSTAGVVTANEGGASISALSPGSSSVTATYTSIGGLNGPFGIAVDGAGNIWAANRGNGAISELSSAGTALSPSSGFLGNGISGPVGFAIAVDGSGDVWVANHDNNSVTEFVGAAVPAVMPIP